MARLGSPREAGHIAPHARDNVGLTCSLCREGDGSLVLGVALQALGGVSQSILSIFQNLPIRKFQCIHQGHPTLSLIKNDWHDFFSNIWIQSKWISEQPRPVVHHLVAYASRGAFLHKVIKKGKGSRYSARREEAGCCRYFPKAQSPERRDDMSFFLPSCRIYGWSWLVCARRCGRQHLVRRKCFAVFLWGPVRTAELMM